MQDAGQVVLAAAVESSKRPLVIAAAISVTSGSSAGSMPLMVMNACWSPWLTSALPISAGAAPSTSGTCRSRATSAR